MKITGGCLYKHSAMEGKVGHLPSKKVGFLFVSMKAL